MRSDQAALDILRRAGPIIQQASDRVKREAPFFRTVPFFGPKEVAQTRIIAGLLNPSGAHGQGDVFLRAFLERIGELQDLPRRPLSDVRISVEQLTRALDTDQRRIDLLITLPSGRLIALESKARGAKEQPNQLESYLNHLKKVSPNNFLLVYLPFDRIAESHEDTATVKRRRYREFVADWLRDCKSKCQAPNVARFIQEFSDVVTDSEGEINMEPATEQLTALVMESQDHLRSYVVMTQADDAVARAVGSRFLQKLEKRVRQMASGGWIVVREDLDLLVKRAKWGRVSVCFEIGTTEYYGNKPTHWTRTILLGLVGPPKTEKQPKFLQSDRLKKVLQTHLGEGRKSNDWIRVENKFPDMPKEDVAVLLYKAQTRVIEQIADEMIRLAKAVDAVHRANDL